MPPASPTSAGEMRSKLLLVIALAILGITATAGGVSAAGGGSLIGVGESGVEINLPTGEDLDQLQVLPQCSNLADDDSDGITDLADPDCAGPLDPSESGTGAPATPEETEPSTSGGGGGNGGGSNGGNGGGETGGGNGVGGGTIGETSGGGGRGEADPADQAVVGDDDPDETDDAREPLEPTEDRNSDGSPTDTNAGLTIADFGPAPVGVPNPVIDSFSIPPFLLPIYQACGTQYGIPWQVLASINRIETAFGTNLNISSAGAMGWMQFIPSSWKMYGVDANEDGRKDPYNPNDAICAAARYLRAAGGQEDLRTAIFAYNHADWYVDEVLLYANQYGKLPSALISSLTGLTEGAHFPVAANARYADDISEREAIKNSAPTKGNTGNAAQVIESSPTRRGIDIFAREGAPVVAVNDGVVTEIGKNEKLGRYLILKDAYGNRFTYANLGEVSEVFPVPKEAELEPKDFKLVSPDDDDEPTEPASAGADQPAAGEPADDGKDEKQSAKQDEEKAVEPVEAEDADAGPVNTEDSRERLYAFPERAANDDRADLTGQLDSLLGDRFPGYESFKAYFSGVLRFDEKTMELERLEEGSQVIAGTVLGKIGQTDDFAPRVHFTIRPAGRGAPTIDPKPILDGWKLLEATAIYRAAGDNPFTDGATVGQVLLMSKTQLIERVLTDPRIEIYACGREDIRTGQIDRRILALLEYLAERGFRLTITSLKCGHSVYTTSGNVSHHSSGNAVDIAQINGLPVLGNQGRGSITEALVRDTMELQGTMYPAQIISLMDMGANTFAMGDHADHVHVGFQPVAGTGPNALAQQFDQILKPDQWERLIDRIGEIDNPTVPTEPSEFALPAEEGHEEKPAGKQKAGKQKSGKSGKAVGGAAERASSAHIGE